MNSREQRRIQTELKILEALLNNSMVHAIPDEHTVPEEFLTIAIQLERVQALSVLVKDPDLRLKEAGITLLEYAIRWCKREAIRTLLELGADPNVYYYRPPLLETRGVETCRDLLRYGANPDLQDAQGRTAMMRAPCIEFVRELLLYDAEVDLQDKQHRTALMHLSRNPEAVVLLLSYGARDDFESY